jgi:hypothetical protein
MSNNSLKVIDKLKIILNKIIELVSFIENNPDIDYSAYPIDVTLLYPSDFNPLYPANVNPLQDMKRVLITPPNYNGRLKKGYQRYKPSENDDGHNGLKCLIYGILFKSSKFINDENIDYIIRLLYLDETVSSILLSKPSENKSNFKYANIETQSNTKKRHVLDVLNTLMALIDESFSYGYSSWQGQNGKKGWGGLGWTPDSISVDPNTDTLGYLIFIIAVYNVRWLTQAAVEQYKTEFAQALIQCDLPNINGKKNPNCCKDPSLQRQIKSIDEILAVQSIDNRKYLSPF